MKTAFKLLNNKITFLVLDYNRPIELELCLKSIRQQCLINHEVITLVNGGNTSSHYELFKTGLTDKLILSAKNEGSSLGILRLVQNCTTDIFIFLQSDNILAQRIDFSIFNGIQTLLSVPHVGAIDLTGLVPTISEFSERAFIMKTDFYLAHDLNTGYGTGPFYDPQQPNSEQTTLEWLKKNSKQVIPSSPPCVVDTGKYAILELPCGGILKRRTDTHQIWVIKTPKNKIDCYDLSESEWETILSGKWIGGTTPEISKSKAFFFYSKEADQIG